MNEEQLRQSTTKLAAIDANSFIADSVPNPHRAFESYTFHLTQTHGLCRIQGIGADVAMNAFGTQLKEQFQELAEALDEKYGTHKSLEAVAPGSGWNNPEDWPMALVQQEALLAATWDFTNIPRDDGIQGMTLEASAMSREKGYVILTYYFDNSDLCIREITGPTTLCCSGALSGLTGGGGRRNFCTLMREGRILMFRNLINPLAFAAALL